MIADDLALAGERDTDAARCIARDAAFDCVAEAAIGDTAGGGAISIATIT
ncbi:MULTISPECIES: hypothetical protein [unclassified Burkholderia]|nr:MULTISPECIES: hypothetical protein [unclassified Burkholderia]